jgi:hypothetical protein
MGSGIGSSSAQALRNSKKLSVFKNITALKTVKEPAADKNGNKSLVKNSFVCGTGYSRFFVSVAA